MEKFNEYCINFIKDQQREKCYGWGGNMIKRKYKDDVKEIVYENCIDCLVYGYGKEALNTLGLDDKIVNELWNTAIKTLEKF